MGTGELSVNKIILSKRIEELPGALDVFCKPQAFSREELIKAADNIIIPAADLSDLERAGIIFLVKDLFVLMYQSGLNNAQRALWGALAKTHTITIARSDQLSEIKLEDSSTGAHVLLKLYSTVADEKLFAEFIKKPASQCVALLLMATSFKPALLERIQTKITGDIYESQIAKGCSLDLFEYSLVEPSSYCFNLIHPRMPRAQSATVALC